VQAFENHSVRRLQYLVPVRPPLENARSEGVADPWMQGSLEPFTKVLDIDFDVPIKVIRNKAERM